MGLSPSTQILLQELEQEELRLGSINGVLGGLPVAEQTQDYFLVFKGVGGTGPEIIDNTAYFIQYVVDSDGNIFKPSQGSIARLNVLQNFPTGKLATVRIDNASGINTQLDGDHIVTGIGTQQPLLYTQYGIPSSSYTQSIGFLTPGGAPAGTVAEVPDILGGMIKNSFTFNSSSLTAITDYTSTLLSPLEGANINLPGGQYIITNSAIENINQINIKTSYVISNLGSTQREVIIRIVKDLVEWEDNFTIKPGQFLSRTLNVSYTPDYVGTYDILNIKVYASAPIYFQSLKLEVPSTNPMPPARTQTTFWSTGSHTDVTWLTASSYLSNNYGNIQDSDSFPQAISFNFSPIKTQFIPQPGDRIRFEYNPQKDYIIYEVISPDEDSDGLLKLKLNNIISPNTILDNFVLHRVDNSILKYMILDVPKDPVIDNPENPFTGLILPKYPSEKLKNNLENIVLKLKEAGVIQN